MRKSFKMVLPMLVLIVMLTSNIFAINQDVVVDATAHSTNGGSGTGLDTGISLTTGQNLNISVDPNDLWNAGALYRWSNANGLNGVLFYNGIDPEVTSWNSNIQTGNQIGQNFGAYNGAYYGSLMGKIGNGNLFFIGTNYTGTTTNAGNLKLYYNDGYTSDNFGTIKANVSVTPEPISSTLFLIGAGFLAFSQYKKRNK